MSASVEIKALAYAKLILHAAKYPHTAVNGLFVAKKSDMKNKSLIIIDAIPLFHSFLSLSPMLEAALYQIDSYCNEEELMIAGYYQANDLLDNNGLSHISMKIADKINEASGLSCLIMLKNDKLSLDCMEDPIALYLMQDSRWKETKNYSIEDEAQQKTACLLESKTYRTLVDFDNHLDDIRLNWRNAEFSQLLQQMT